MMRTIARGVLGLLGACAGAGSSGDGGGSVAADTREIQLQVAYEADAAPYVGAAGLSGRDTWSMYGNNLAALVEGTAVTVTHPHALDQMTAMGSLEGETYTSDRILALADTHLPIVPEDGVIVYRAIWLDGTWEEDGASQPGVLGVSLGRTGVIGMFKPVIEGTSVLDPVRRFGEQATILHEVGHALGLVNNGVEMVQAHQDEAHGSHCDDDRCVMYWANEGAGDLAEFVQQVVVTGDEVLFDSACRADVAAALD